MDENSLCQECGGEFLWSDLYIAWECQGCGELVDDDSGLPIGGDDPLHTEQEVK
jgi:hypothetical protein